MILNHSKALPAQAGTHWPYQILTVGNPHVPRQHPDGVRYQVLFPDGNKSPRYNRYHTCERIIADDKGAANAPLS